MMKIDKHIEVLKSLKTSGEVDLENHTHTSNVVIQEIDTYTAYKSWLPVLYDCLIGQDSKELLENGHKRVLANCKDTKKINKLLKNNLKISRGRSRGSIAGLLYEYDIKVDLSKLDMIRTLIGIYYGGNVYDS